MNKKKILIVANGLSNLGGIGNALHSMIRAMFLYHHDFELDLMLFDYESKKFIQDLPITFNEGKFNYKMNLSFVALTAGVFAGKIPFSFLWHRILYKFYYRLPLINDIANSVEPLKKHYDLAISYNCIPNFITNYVANNVYATIKVAWTHTCICQKYKKYYGKNSTLRINGLKAYIRILNKFNKIYAVSNGVKSSLIYEIDKNLNVDIFSNFIDKDIIASKSNESFDSPYSKDCIILLTVGRLSYEKGIKLALATANQLNILGYIFKWVFIGDVLEDKYIRKYIHKHHLEDRIVVLGQVSNPYPYFKDCDIYVHTSFVEGYCTTTNEARMLGKPIVTTDVAGAEEQVINGVNGFIVKHDVNDIFIAVKKLIDSIDLRYKFARYNNKLAFDNKESIRKLRELMDLLK